VRNNTINLKDIKTMIAFNIFMAGTKWEKTIMHNRMAKLFTFTGINNPFEIQHVLSNKSITSLHHNSTL